MDHLHVSFASFLVTWLYVIVGGYLLRAWTYSHPDGKLAQALSVVY